jgi:hypothetical protein
VAAVVTRNAEHLPDVPSQDDSDVYEAAGMASISDRGPLRPVTLRDLGVPEYDILEEYLPRGLADHLLFGAFRCFEAVTGVACGIGLDGKHYKVLLYDNTLAPDLPARLRDVMPDYFKLVEKDVACVPLMHSQLDEQAWEWNTTFPYIRRSADGGVFPEATEGTIGWIGQDPQNPENGHGVTARHVLYWREQADFRARCQQGDWTGRSTESFLSRGRALPQSHPALPLDADEAGDRFITKGDLAIVDVGGVPAERRVATLLARGVTHRTLLERATSASLVDIQGRVIPDELRTLNAQDAQGKNVVLRNLLVGNVVMITHLNEGGVRETRELHNMVMMQLFAPRDTMDLYSPHTTEGNSGAALTMTSGCGRAAVSTVIGFLRGMLNPISPTVSFTVKNPEVTFDDQKCFFRVFTPSNYTFFNERGELKSYLLDYFQNHDGFVYPLRRPPTMWQKLTGSASHLFHQFLQ